MFVVWLGIEYILVIILDLIIDTISPYQTRYGSESMHISHHHHILHHKLPIKLKEVIFYLPLSFPHILSYSLNELTLRSIKNLNLNFPVSCLNLSRTGYMSFETFHDPTNSFPARPLNDWYLVSLVSIVLFRKSYMMVPSKRFKNNCFGYTRCMISVIFCSCRVNRFIF